MNITFPALIIPALILDTFIVVDKLIVPLTLLTTKLLSGLLYSAPVANASIVQELFVFDIEMLVPAMRVILPCILLDRFETFVFKVTMSLDKIELKLNKVPISVERLFNGAFRFVVLD